MKGEVIFEPYVGNDYDSDGARLLGRRVMVVGASHYCEHFHSEHGCSKACAHFGNYRFSCRDRSMFFGNRCELFTQIVVERYCKWIGDKEQRKWFRTFTRFYNSFFKGGKATHKARVRLIDHIAITEYVQGAEGREPTDNDGLAMSSDRNFIELEKTVSLLRPDVLIFWGKRAWREVCRRCGIGDIEPEIQHVTLGGMNVTIVRIVHPVAYGFKRAHVQKQLTDVGIKILALAFM